jgi:8-hydroxy-5-deazaflavin:NADPH oxidoreductase
MLGAALRRRAPSRAPQGTRNEPPAATVPPGMTTIGLIGSGHIGGTVARLAVAAGHDVVLSNSRGPETLQELAEELGDRARAGTAPDAAQADVVVLTIPLKNVGDVPSGVLRDKVVIDTSNYYPQRDGQIAALDDGSATTSELVQSQLAGSRLVKGLNNINFVHLGSLQRPSGSSERSVLPIAGDDPGAKQRVSDLFDSLGYDAYDTGVLADSWRFDVGTPAYGRPYNADTTGSFPPPPGSGRQVTAEQLREALDAARR